MRRVLGETEDSSKRRKRKMWGRLKRAEDEGEGLGKNVGKKSQYWAGHLGELARGRGSVEKKEGRRKNTGGPHAL